MLSAPSKFDLFCILVRFFEICREPPLIILLSKFDFFLSEVAWYGRIIDAHEIRLHPESIAGLSDCEPPCTAGEL